MILGLNKEQMPTHVAIIMDGNGRWAQSRNLSRSQGHRAGVKRVEEIVDYSIELGIKCITLFTFSTENWNRPENEITMLMNTLVVVLNRKIQKLKKQNTKFQMIGRRQRVPKAVLSAIEMVEEGTKDNTGLIMNLAFNYGSRIEIVEAVKEISNQVKSGDLAVEDINEESISTNLYTKNLPDPDLLIRTSGEKRISNFLLWQLSYAELYFTDKYWPDFDRAEFTKALTDYQNRERRFGHAEKVNQ